MIDFIQGKVVYRDRGKVVIDFNGIGLSVYIPENLLLEGKVKLFTYLAFKDEELKLFGFKSREDRDLFLKLISVSGIGVKNAMSMLSSFSSDELIDIIERGDITTLSSIPGIGKKTAQRIIFELRGKLDFYTNEVIEDVVEALTGLGYEKKSALKVAIDVTRETKNLEEAIKLALQKLSQKG